MILLSNEKTKQWTYRSSILWRWATTVSCHRAPRCHFQRNSRRVLDIGGNIGYCALLLGSIVGSKGKVYSIEPSSENFELLNENISLNKMEAIIETFHFSVFLSSHSSNLSRQIARVLVISNTLKTISNSRREIGLDKELSMASTTGIAELKAYQISARQFSGRRINSQYSSE